MVCRATLIERNDGSAGHWASTYMDAAVKHNLFSADEYSEGDWDKPIRRQDMAFIVVRAALQVRKEHSSTDTEAYISKIKDLTSIPEKRQSEVLQAYAKGIVSGHPDGNFYGAKSATRAEAAAMILRLIHTDERMVA